MFGNSNKDDTSNQMDSFGGDDNTSSFGSPGLPTMSSQPAFTPPPSTPMTQNPYASPAPDASSAPLSSMPDAPDASHAIADHGTPDSHDSASTEGDGSLVDIKQQALRQLSPLVAHLEQSAEEKFRTTMMMIQATDDQSLLSVAYESAQKIEDDKSRAQALLDVINEINYFTQQNK